MSAPRRQRIAVAITGATGAVFGVRLLQRLSVLDVEVHLVISQWGRKTIEHESVLSVDEVKAMADVVHPIGDQASTMSSGSFRMDAMIIAPCSVRTMAAIAHGLADNLITRAADVMLKERRKLVLMVRESPLSDIHLQNMLTVSRAGAVVFPPMPAFYTLPQTIDDVVDQIVNRALDQLGLEQDDFVRWDGRLGRRESEPATSASVSSESPEYPEDTQGRTPRKPGLPEAGHAGDAFADTFEGDRPSPSAHRADEDADRGA